MGHRRRHHDARLQRERNAAQRRSGQFAGERRRDARRPGRAVARRAPEGILRRRLAQRHRPMRFRLSRPSAIRSATAWPVAGNAVQGDIAALNGGRLASAWAHAVSERRRSTATCTRRRSRCGGSSPATAATRRSMAPTARSAMSFAAWAARTSSMARRRRHDQWRAGERHDHRRRRRRHRGVHRTAPSTTPSCDFGSKIVVTGAEGVDTLSGIEHLQFADGTIHVVNDGNALFDTLYYLSRNPDVFHAGVERARPLQRRRLARRPRSERVLRHVGLSRGQHGRGGGRHQPARPLSSAAAGTRGAIRRPTSTRRSI